MFLRSIRRSTLIVLIVRRPHFELGACAVKRALRVVLWVYIAGAISLMTACMVSHYRWVGFNVPAKIIVDDAAVSALWPIVVVYLIVVRPDLE